MSNSPTDRYPALMAYITSRTNAGNWLNQLHADESEALAGGLADVASELAQAKADYADTARGRGYNTYPYNKQMGEFLGLEINPNNHEPPRGYYMAGQVQNYHRLGVARREVCALVEAGTLIRVVAARAMVMSDPSTDGWGQERRDGAAWRLLESMREKMPDAMDCRGAEVIQRLWNEEKARADSVREGV